LISILIILLFIICIVFWIFRKRTKYREGLGIDEDRTKTKFTKTEISQLKRENANGKGFQILDYKKKNVADFLVKKRIGETEIKAYYGAKTEKGLKKMWDALNAHKKTQKTIIDKAINDLNKSSTVSKYFKDINKNIKLLITIIDEALLQMPDIYKPPSIIPPLYSELTKFRPELNSVLYSMYTSSKIALEMLEELSTFITYMQTTFSTKLKDLQPKLESLYSLSNEYTSDKHKAFLDKLREFEAIINKIINAIQLIQMEDVSKIKKIIKDAWLIYNIDQMLDYEEIQLYKPRGAKW